MSRRTAKQQAQARAYVARQGAIIGVHGKGYPPDSWWAVRRPQAGWTAYVEREQLPRMMQSSIGKAHQHVFAKDSEAGRFKGQTDQSGEW